MKELIELFNEKADKLLNSPLTKEVLSKKIEFSAKFKTNEPGHITYTDFNEYDLDSFTFTLRLFVQDKDRISLRAFNKAFCSSGFSQNHKEKVSKSCESLNKFLDSPIVISWQDSPDTYRTLFFIVLYGGLAHTEDSDEYKTFKKWMKDDIFFTSQIWVHFLVILKKFLIVIKFIRDINSEILQTYY